MYLTETVRIVGVYCTFMTIGIGGFTHSKAQWRWFVG